ncbi:MAG: UDP-N-acetylglucosamine 2-epimerase (non-hydrolyzing) [Proteobacteria bacterium]|nr:UDP-N-acetylglucosamine 2-epimerase (non-hydrolyzing) [Pseudomonadota bacterium]
MARRILTVVGARPQFIKAAAFSRALRAEPGLEERLVHTGQHFDDNMSGVFFRELGVRPPDISLDIHGGGHGQMTGRMLEALEAAMIEDRPDAVLVYGDTNSTLAAALAAAKLHIRLIHIEAGLRSHNRRMPEEVNRVLTDHAADLLLAPTRLAMANLAAEGLADRARLVGDVMYDATLHAIAEARRGSSILQRLGLEGRPFAIATVHRAENTDDPAQLARIVAYLRRAAGQRTVVFPVHPRTALRLAEAGVDTGGLMLTEPLSYFDLHRLVDAAELVMTDSGGLQKEAYFHRTPCITLRDETEWAETIEAGWNRLWTDPGPAPERRDIPDYGAGAAATACVAAIRAFLEPHAAMEAA